MDIKEIGCEDADWIHVAQKRFCARFLRTSDEILDRTNCKEFHEQRGLYTMEPM